MTKSLKKTLDLIIKINKPTLRIKCDKCELTTIYIKRPPEIGGYQIILKLTINNKTEYLIEYFNDDNILVNDEDKLLEIPNEIINELMWRLI
jgi:hypothetical protein